MARVRIEFNCTLEFDIDTQEEFDIPEEEFEVLRVYGPEKYEEAVEELVKDNLDPDGNPSVLAVVQVVKNLTNPGKDYNRREFSKGVKKGKA